MEQTLNVSSFFAPAIDSIALERHFTSMITPEIETILEQARDFHSMITPELETTLEQARHFHSMITPELDAYLEQARHFHSMITPELDAYLEQAGLISSSATPYIDAFLEQTRHFPSIITPKMSTLVQTLDTSSLIAAAIDASTLTQALNTSYEIFDVVQSTTGWQEGISNSIVELCSDLNSVTLGLTADFAAIDLSSFSLPLNDIFHDLIRIHEEQEEAIEAAEAFKAAGWPIAPSMSRQLRERVISLHKQGKTRYISNAIMGYYHRRNYENLRNTVDSWRGHPLFGSRMNIIDDALDAHCNKKYTLSVPTLFPLIEGILNEYVTINNLPVRCGRIGRVYEAVIGDPDDYSLATWAIANTLLYQLRNNTYVYTNFDDELKKSSNGRCISRHTVLHGVSTNYNKPSQSLKILVLLDAISALHDEIE